VHVNHYVSSQSGNFGESMITFDKAIKINPRDSIAWKAKGILSKGIK
jgi:Flp pilus assembly protein TadD